MDHKLTTHDLAGGAKLLAIHVPNSVSDYVGSYVRSGSEFAPRDLHEISHLLEHLAFEGTKSYPDPLTFKSLVEQNGAYFNAYTGQTLNWYEMVGAIGEAERLLPLATSQLYEPLYAENRIKQQQETVINELKRYKENDNHRIGYYSFQRIMPTLFPDMDDRMEMTAKTTREDLLSYHSGHYGTANTFVVLAGDFPRARLEKIKDLLNADLANRPEGKLLEFSKPEYANFGGSIDIYQPYRQNQSYFVLRSFIPEHDQRAAVVLRIIATAYAYGLSSRLQMKAREAGLTYAVNSGPYLRLFDTSFAVGSETTLDKIEPLIELSMSELADITEHGLGADEFERAKSYAAGSMRRSYQTPVSYAGWYASDFAEGQPLISPEDWIAELESVGAKDIEAVAQRFFKAGNMTLTIIGKDLEAKKSHFDKMLKRYFA